MHMDSAYQLLYGMSGAQGERGPQEKLCCMFTIVLSTICVQYFIVIVLFLDGVLVGPICLILWTSSGRNVNLRSEHFLS